MLAHLLPPTISPGSQPPLCVASYIPGQIFGKILLLLCTIARLCTGTSSPSSAHGSVSIADHGASRLHQQRHGWFCLTVTSTSPLIALSKTGNYCNPIFLDSSRVCSPILAFQRRRQNGKRFREGLAYSLKMLVLVALSISAACFFSGKWIMSLFLSSGPSVTQAGELLLRSQTISAPCLPCPF